jgi:hypothetical protein
LTSKNNKLYCILEIKIQKKENNNDTFAVSFVGQLDDAHSSGNIFVGKVIFF